MKYLLTFETVSMVLLFENLMKERKIPVKLSPVPRNYSSSCGTCAVLEVEDIKELEEYVNKNHVYIEGIYEI